MALLPQVPDLFPVLFTTFSDFHVRIIACARSEVKQKSIP